MRRLTRKGQLVRLGRGLYAAASLEPTEHHTLAEVAKRVPKGVFCLLTALRFHGLGTQNPREVWLAVDRRAGIPRVDFTPVRVVRISGAALSTGIDEHDIEGVRVRITSPARTVVDCFKFRNKIGIDVAVEALKDYRRLRKGTADELWRQADRLRLAKVIRPYWDGDVVMKRKTPVNVAASVRARLLKVSKERREDFTLTLMNYAAERFLYRLSRSKHRDQFVLKGAMLFAVRIGEQYRPTRDLDLLGLGEATEAAINAAVRDIVAVAVDDDGLVFDLASLEVHPIREDNRYGGIRAVMQTHVLRRLASTSRLTSGSVTRSRRPRWTWNSRHSLATCRRRMCWRIRRKPSSPRRPKRWSISASRTAA